jgi:hypothetical protein
MNKKTKKILIISLSILLSVPFFFGLYFAFSYEYRAWIQVEQLDSKPDRYINITHEQLDQWPLLKQALELNSVDVPNKERDQLQEIKEFFMERRTFNFKINDSYYNVTFIST